MHQFVKILLIFILLLNSQIHLFAIEKPVKAQNGTIDLTGTNFNITNSVSLNGEWIFFPDTLIAPFNIIKAIEQLPHQTITVPSKRSETEGVKFGTYYLQINLDSSINTLTVNSLTIYSAASIYVNNELVGHVGQPTQSINTTKPGLILKTNNFSPKKENHLVVHYANYYREKNGLANNINLVRPKFRIKNASIGALKYAIIIGTILFIIFNQINFFIIRRSNLTSFYFGIASLMIASYIFFMSFYHLGVLLPDFNPNFFVTLKTWRFAYYMTVCFFMIYIYSLFPSIFPKIILLITIVYTSFSAILTFFAPLYISSINFNIFMYFTMFIGSFSVAIGVIGVIRKIENAGLFLLGFGFLIATVINDVLHNLLLIHSVNMLDVGIFGMMLTQAQILNSKLNQSIISSEKLSKHLQYVNANLENIVHRRTEEIEEQKTEIESQRDFALSQHKLISTQKKTITDSINYAREIQHAVLPNEEILREYFKDSFILFKPKDFVSGDFYFIKHFSINNTPYLLFCVADCTGHGVPGALLSMLGMSMLNDIIGHDNINKASAILELLRTKFKQTLGSKRENENSSDGMHITLCLINKNSGEMQYSGAFQAIYYIRDNKVKKIKGTNCIIGNFMREIPFENHTVQLQQNDRLYLFTDGFADQMAESGQGRFMQKRLIKLLSSYNGKPYKAQKQSLMNEFEKWKGNYEQIDDILVMGVKI